MTGRELAILIGPLLGPAARDRLRALVSGAVEDIALRYDEILDWKKMHAIIIAGDKSGTINFFDGEEHFLLEPVGATDDRCGTGKRDCEPA